MLRRDNASNEIVDVRQVDFSLTRQIEISRYVPSDYPKKEVAAVLAESIGNPTDSKLKALMESCTYGGFPSLWIASRSDAVIGVLRLESQSRSRCTITHIAVHQRLRGQGIGRNLIEFIRDELNFRQEEAETDDDALGFYKACGFEIESIGENSNGTRRYKCVVRVSGLGHSAVPSNPEC